MDVIGYFAEFSGRNCNASVGDCRDGMSWLAYAPLVVLQVLISTGAGPEASGSWAEFGSRPVVLPPGQARRRAAVGAVCGTL
jgi:hypothetical protein